MSTREKLGISRGKFLHVLATSDNGFPKTTVKCVWSCFAFLLGNRTTPTRKRFLDVGQQRGKNSDSCNEETNKAGPHLLPRSFLNLGRGSGESNRAKGMSETRKGTDCAEAT